MDDVSIFGWGREIPRRLIAAPGTAATLLVAVASAPFGILASALHTSAPAGHRGLSWLRRSRTAHGILLLLAVTAVAPLGSCETALADAQVAASPVAENIAGLPDGRVYEQVSPAVKNGNYVASGDLPAVEGRGYAAASADGDALVFLGSGAMGDASSSVLGPYVARRSADGWETSSAMPPQTGIVDIGNPTGLIPSTDFASFAFAGFSSYSPEQPTGNESSVDLFRSSDPFAPPAWLGRPGISEPIPRLGESTPGANYILVGDSPDLGRAYFSYSGTLIGEDASRMPNVGDGTGAKRTDPWGFYEWDEGTLRSGGVLPDGTISPFGAVPATVAGEGHNSGTWQAAGFDNEVSTDGGRAFFVSPDPVAADATNQAACEEEGPCSTSPPELYERLGGAGTETSVLVSRSELPGHEGEPAPDGPLSVASGTIERGGAVDEGDVYASADGSLSFFASADRLATSAPEDLEPKEYRFDLAGQTLEYLPGVVGPILASARDGSDFLFEDTATTPRELELWRSGPDGGQVTPVAALPPAEFIGLPYQGQIGIAARAAGDGSAFMFDTNAPIPGFVGNQEGYGQIYRFDVSEDSLGCLSCSSDEPAGEDNAFISYDNNGGGNSRPRSTVDTRAMSADGSRVFFDTPTALVPRDSNGQRDVYEWEQDGSGSCAQAAGCLYLLSSGAGAEGAFFLDSSESGEDVFLNTSVALRPEDTDEAFDAYDARAPRSGDSAGSGSTAPCQPAACQGQPSPPEAEAPPASATISGPGNASQAARPKPHRHRRPKRHHYRRHKHHGRAGGSRRGGTR
jgi:hypothetical protein